MSAWFRIAVAALVLVVPGAFLVVLAWLSGRAMHDSYQRAVAQAEAQGVPVDYREVITGSFNIRELMRQAKAAI